MSKKNKSKGNRYELQICNELKDLGFKDCVTSRSESRNRDNQKVDLCNTGFLNVQCKFYDSNQPNFRKVLGEMPEEDNTNVVFHKTRYKKDIVVMYKEDFYKLIK